MVPGKSLPIGEWDRAEVAMVSKAVRVEEEPRVDATTILDNVVQLDEMLDEGSRRKLSELPYLELSKHLKIKKT